MGTQRPNSTAVQIVDLSHPYANGMPVYPGLPQPSFQPIAEVEQDGFAMTRYELLNHIGTHVDAPAHQIAGGDTLDVIPLGSTVRRAIPSTRRRSTCTVCGSVRAG